MRPLTQAVTHTANRMWQAVMSASKRSTAKTDIGSASSTPIIGLFAQSGVREAWWPLTPSLCLASNQPSVEAPNVVEGQGAYISFSPKDDHCILLNKNQRVLVSDLASDIGEDIYTQRMQAGTVSEQDAPLIQKLNSSWLYATTQSRINELPPGVQLISGYAALRALLSRSSLLKELHAPFVTGVLFHSEEAELQVLILMVCSEKGELSGMDYIPLAGLDPESAIRSFVQNVRLSSSGEWSQERTAIFSAQALLDVSLKAYPGESYFYGVASSLLFSRTKVASAALLACTVTATLCLTYSNSGIKTNTKKTADAMLAQQTEITRSLSGDQLGSLLKRRSVDVETAIAKATAVWQNGALVSLKATKDLLTLTVTHKVQTPEQSPELLAQALSIAAPKGCTRTQSFTTTQVTELYLNYECQTSDPDLQRLGSAAH